MSPTGQFQVDFLRQDMRLRPRQKSFFNIRQADLLRRDEVTWKSFSVRNQKKGSWKLGEKCRKKNPDCHACHGASHFLLMRLPPSLGGEGRVLFFATEMCFMLYVCGVYLFQRDQVVCYRVGLIFWGTRFRNIWSRVVRLIALLTGGQRVLKVYRGWLGVYL